MDNLTEDFKKLTKRTKWKKWIKIIITAVVSAIVVVVLAGFGLNWYSNHASNSFEQSTTAAAKYAENENANVYTTTPIQESYGAVTKQASIATYKNIDGYKIAWQPQTWVNGQLINKYGALTFSENDAYLDSSQKKVAIFYTTDKKILDSKDYAWGKPTQEARMLAQQKNQLAELAVTFDKPYTYRQIQKMIPSNLLINWYWAGGTIENATGSGNGVGIPSTFGLASTLDSQGNPTGKLTDSTYKEAINAMNSKNYEEFMIDGVSYLYKTYNKNLTSQAHIDVENVKFSGVILTGRSENFAGLDQQPGVYASSVGLTTPIVPYHTPIK